jgi:nitrite reductase (NADH) large subunit
MNKPTFSWICPVCGYIHHGAEPPDECPVCGAPKSDFEPYEEPPTKTMVKKESKWQCLICGYIHESSEPPQECPLCGATADNFEPLEEFVIPPSIQNGVTVIAGGGIAALTAAISLRKSAPNARVIMISREKELPYYRLNLTRLLAGEIGEKDLPIHDGAWFDEQKIELFSGQEIRSLAPDKNTIGTDAGNQISYDHLILACGAHAFIPPLSGLPMKGVFTLRTQEDARAIIDHLKPGIKVVCIGGGILGLETAGALTKRGAHVTVLEGLEYIMPRQLSRTASVVVEEFLRNLGIHLVTNARTRGVSGQTSVSFVELESGEKLGADLVVISAGVRSNTNLARSAGLAVNNGVLVDNFLRTSDPNIFAAGDAAEHQGLLYGSWAAAQYQGSIAGMNAAGLSVEFGGMPRSHTLKVLGLGMTSIGKFEPEDASYQILEDRNGLDFQRFVFRDERMVGAILLGDTKLAAATTKVIEKKINFSKLLEKSFNISAIQEKLTV